MKRTILLILLGAAVGAGAVWMSTHSAHFSKPDADDAAAKPAEDEADKVSITRDAEGNVVIGMSDEKQGDIGITVAEVSAAQSAAEWKGYGHALDPAPLAALMTELTAAQSAYNASSNDLVRLQSLSGQGNASPRALQTAEATAQRDASALQSARDRLLLSWGVVLAGRDDLPTFVQSLTTLKKVLVRLDLPLGEKIEAQPLGAVVETVSGSSTEAKYLGAALGVDPVIQGRGFLFLMETNTLQLLAGEAVSGRVKISGDALSGVIVPRDAVVRTEGKGWAYVLNSNGESFTRREVPLDHPTETGWFVTNGVSAGNHVVITGAQILLSEELKGALGAD